MIKYIPIMLILLAGCDLSRQEVVDAVRYCRTHNMKAEIIYAENGSIYGKNVPIRVNCTAIERKCKPLYE